LSCSTGYRYCPLPHSHFGVVKVIVIDLVAARRTEANSGYPAFCNPVINDCVRSSTGQEDAVIYVFIDGIAIQGVCGGGLKINPIKVVLNTVI
jgi:hypothetical protein